MSTARTAESTFTWRPQSEADSAVVWPQTVAAVEGGTELLVHQSNGPTEYLTPEGVPAFQSSFDKLSALLGRAVSTDAP